MRTFRPTAFKLHHSTGPAVMCGIPPHEKVKVNLRAAEGFIRRGPCPVAHPICQDGGVLQHCNIDDNGVDALQQEGSKVTNKVNKHSSACSPAPGNAFI